MCNRAHAKYTGEPEVLVGSRARARYKPSRSIPRSAARGVESRFNIQMRDKGASVKKLTNALLSPVTSNVTIIYSQINPNEQCPNAPIYSVQKPSLSTASPSSHITIRPTRLVCMTPECDASALRRGTPSAPPSLFTDKFYIL